LTLFLLQLGRFHMQLVKNNEGKTVEEVKHQWWKKLENALNVREIKDDDVLELT